jgi:hypothetical protein
MAVRDEWGEVMAAKRRGELTDPSAAEKAVQTIRGVALVSGIRLAVVADAPWDADEEIPGKWRVKATAAEHISAERFMRFAGAVTIELREFGADVLYATYAAADDDTLVFDRCVLSNTADGFPTCAWPVRCNFWCGPAGRLE